MNLPLCQTSLDILHGLAGPVFTELNGNDPFENAGAGAGPTKPNCRTPTAQAINVDPSPPVSRTSLPKARMVRNLDAWTPNLDNNLHTLFAWPK